MWRVGESNKKGERERVVREREGRGKGEREAL